MTDNDSTSRFQNIVSATRDAIVCADDQGIISYVNPAAETLFGYSNAQLVGQNLTILMPPSCREAHIAGFKRFMETRHPKIVGTTIEMTGTNKDGLDFPIELSLSENTVGKKVEVFGIIRDISERRDLVTKLEQMAKTDYLTGLWNRQAFDERLKEEFARARRYEKDLSVFMADLDHFKEYNDLYGHQAGDNALKKIAKVMSNSVRNIDLVARYGGEEFVAVLPETSPIHAQALAERVLIDVQNAGIKHVGFAKTGLLTVSVGVAGLSEKDDDGSDILSRADRALYSAKDSGRNRVCAADNDGNSMRIFERPADKPKETV